MGLITIALLDLVEYIFARFRAFKDHREGKILKIRLARKEVSILTNLDLRKYFLK